MVGNRLDNVKQQLAALNLTVDEQYVDSGEAKDTVIDVDPKAGTKVPEGSPVKVKVSRGNVNKVPDVVGFTKDRAVKALKDAGYDNVRVVDGDEVAPDQVGTVTRQSPDAQSNWAKDKRVTIEIGIAAPTPTETPASPTSPAPTGTPTAPGGGGGWPLPTTRPPGAATQ